MFGKTISYAIQGIDATKIIVEADVKGGLFKFSIVGLPSNSVKKAEIVFLLLSRIRDIILNLITTQ